jgi:hypothetical protein
MRRPVASFLLVLFFAWFALPLVQAQTTAPACCAAAANIIALHRPPPTDFVRSPTVAHTVTSGQWLRMAILLSVSPLAIPSM